MDKRAKKLGYANAEEMREKYKNNEVSPWLLGVYTGNFVPPGKFKNFPKFCPKFISTLFLNFRLVVIATSCTVYAIENCEFKEFFFLNLPFRV